MNKEELKKILPHREPMLLIDEAELVDGVSTAKYTVRGDEFFLQGHFPEYPVVPGVILCEMMGQASCLLVERGEEKMLTFYAGLNNVRFKNKVLPGDTIDFKSELIKKKGPVYMVKSAGYVNDVLCVSGDLTFVIAKGE